MSKKQQPREDLFARRRWERFSQAKPIKETWPFVSTFTFEFEYPGCDLEPRKFHCGPDDKAFFGEKCHYNDCFQGGFELTNRVSMMVERREEEILGELHCPGFIEKGYGGPPPRCDARLKFRITVRYRA